MPLRRQRPLHEGPGPRPDPVAVLSEETYRAIRIFGVQPIGGINTENGVTASLGVALSKLLATCPKKGVQHHGWPTQSPIA